jgi:hypothetical protein
MEEKTNLLTQKLSADFFASEQRVIIGAEFLDCRPNQSIANLDKLKPDGENIDFFLMIHDLIIVYDAAINLVEVEKNFSFIEVNQTIVGDCLARLEAKQKYEFKCGEAITFIGQPTRFVLIGGQRHSRYLEIKLENCFVYITADILDKGRLRRTSFTEHQ